MALLPEKDGPTTTTLYVSFRYCLFVTGSYVALISSPNKHVLALILYLGLVIMKNHKLGERKCSGRSPCC